MRVQSLDLRELCDSLSLDPDEVTRIEITRREVTVNMVRVIPIVWDH